MDKLSDAGHTGDAGSITDEIAQEVERMRERAEADAAAERLHAEAAKLDGVYYRSDGGAYAGDEDDEGRCQPGDPTCQSWNAEEEIGPPLPPAAAEPVTVPPAMDLA